MYVFLDFRVVIIKNGEIIEASFMMMNQVDSSSFDDDKKPKRMISRFKK